MHRVFNATLTMVCIAITAGAAPPPGWNPSTPIPDPPYAFITYPAVDANSASVSVVTPCPERTFDLVQVEPDQVLRVTIQFPTDRAFQVARLTALDGALVLPPANVSPVDPTTSTMLTPPCFGCPQGPIVTLVIDGNAQLTFSLVATHNPGRNQVVIRIVDPTGVTSSKEMAMHFWVRDVVDPDNNPPAISPTNPNW